jgi:hypothetical protein
MELKGSLPYSQEPATGHCPEPDIASIQFTTSHPIFLRTILILSSHLWGGHFTWDFSTKMLYSFLITPMSPRP